MVGKCKQLHVLTAVLASVGNLFISTKQWQVLLTNGLLPLVSDYSRILSEWQVSLASLQLHCITREHKSAW